MHAEYGAPACSPIWPAFLPKRRCRVYIMRRPGPFFSLFMPFSDCFQRLTEIHHPLFDIFSPYLVELVVTNPPGPARQPRQAQPRHRFQISQTRHHASPAAPLPIENGAYCLRTLRFSPSYHIVLRIHRVLPRLHPS